MKVFVFGSNEAGRHGKGAALFAMKQRGAIYGQAEGLQGNSYAIPTKDRNIRTLSTYAIGVYVDRFIRFAKDNPGLEFELTAVGCGLAGYKPFQIAPLFRGVPKNVEIPGEFMPYLGGSDRCLL